MPCFLVNQINRLPPEVVKYFTDPDAVEAPDMELLFPFVDSALPLAYGVLGVLLFHVSISFFFWHFFNIIVIKLNLSSALQQIGVSFIRRIVWDSRLLLLLDLVSSL